MSYSERKRSAMLYMEFCIVSSSVCEKHLETVFGTKAGCSRLCIGLSHSCKLAAVEINIRTAAAAHVWALLYLRCHLIDLVRWTVMLYVSWLSHGHKYVQQCHKESQSSTLCALPCVQNSLSACTAFLVYRAGIPCKAPSKSKFSSRDRNSRVCFLTACWQRRECKNSWKPNKSKQ